MSNLYHKYRPETLQGLKGNEKVVQVLENLLNKPEKISQAFLIHGGTGCGKTTLARIIKNTLEISDNDYMELNASDDRGIDAIRNIIKNSYYKPLESTHKVYVLDESHMLTKDAQNALLKILEDTPKHVIFILLTTDPNKLIAAIRGRCQQFQMETLEDTDMHRLLLKTAKKEGVRLEDEIIDQIVKDANGHPRNALQILEQVLNTDEDDRLEVAKQSAFEQSQSFDLCKALISNAGWGKVKGILKGLKGQDAEGIRRHVLAYAATVLLNKDDERAGIVLEIFCENLYDSGFSGLVSACYTAIKN